jgi:hypothetical protein
MALVSISGLIADFIKAIGSKESNMDWGSTQFLAKTRNADYGKMESVLSGLIHPRHKL